MNRAQADAIARWTYANKRAARDYIDTPTEFAQLKYCSWCSRTPRLGQHCENCTRRVSESRARGAA